jgi:uncharacterized protein (UPF0276 family)
VTTLDSQWTGFRMKKIDEASRPMVESRVHRQVTGERPATLGHGVGLRRNHYERILTGGPTRVDWFEAISENYMVPGGRALDILTRVRERYRIVLHGVSMSIGSTDPLNEKYLEELAELTRRIEPEWISDHLCWTGVGGHNAHDLLPLPYTEQSLEHVVRRMQHVQEKLGRPIALENPSSYVSYRQSSIPEWEFLAEVARRSGCGILLDVNNIYVSSKNHGFDPHHYLDGIPADKIWQFHLAGHSDKGPYLLDTHDHPVPDAVWALYAEAVRRFGSVSTLIEWDDKIPEFERLEEESEHARRLHDEVLGERVARSRPSAGVPGGARAPRAVEAGR